MFVKLKITTRHALPFSDTFSLFAAPQPAETANSPFLETEINQGDTEPYWEEEEEEDAAPSLPEDMAGILGAAIQESEDGAAFLRKLEALFTAKTAEEESERYIFTTEAEMTVTAGEYRIAYTEAAENGLGATQSCIHIPRNRTDCVIIERNGTLVNTLVCETKQRHVSVYRSAELPIPMEVCTYTRRCEANLTPTGSGVVFLDYILEIRGADIQRTTIRMDITPLRQPIL